MTSASTASPGAGGRRVLIVNDESDIRVTLRAAFGSAGYDCRIAGNGEEAVALYDRERAPLTITDLKMPDMNGYEVCEAIKSSPASSRIPVILLSGTFEPFDRESTCVWMLTAP